MRTTLTLYGNFGQSPEMDTGMRKAMDTENQGVTLRHVSARLCYIKDAVWAVNHSKLKRLSRRGEKVTRT